MVLQNGSTPPMVDILGCVPVTKPLVVELVQKLNGVAPRQFANRLLADRTDEGWVLSVVRRTLGE